MSIIILLQSKSLTHWGAYGL